MTNILIIANYIPNKGGISGVVQNHFNSLRKEGFSVKVFNTKRNILVRLFLILPLFFKIKKYDIIHIHGCSYFGFFPIVISIFVSKILLKKKTIITYHGGGAKDFLQKHTKFVRFFIKKADYTTVMSAFLQKTFEEYGFKTVILKNLINLKINDQQLVHYRIPNIISTRSLNKVYNINDIISAFNSIKKEFPDATLTIAGTGSETKNLKLAAIGTKEISFVGQLESSDIHQVLSKNNIFISVPSHDNQPMSVLEAFANGTIVISSNVGGVPDMITDGFNGLLVEPNNPEQIVEKVRWILREPKKAKNIVKEAYKEVEKYTWTSIKPVLLNLYKN